MPIQELEYAREKDPGFKSVPDAELAQYLAEKDPGFADLPQRVAREQSKPAFPGAPGALGRAPEEVVGEVLAAPYQTETGQPKARAEVHGAWEETATQVMEGGKALAKPFRQLYEFETKGGTDTSHQIRETVEAALAPLKIIGSPAAGLGRLLGETDYYFSENPKEAGAVEFAASLLAPYGLSKGITKAAELGGPKVQAIEEAMGAAKNIPTEEKVREGMNLKPVTPYQFGKQYQEQIYPAGLKTAKEVVKENYNKVFQQAEDKEMNVESIGGPIKESLDKEGIAVKIMPTKAEKLGMKISGAIDPASEEENIYKSVRSMLSPEQQVAFREGGQSLPRQVLNKLFEGLPSFGGPAAAERVAGLSKELALPEKIGLDEAVILQKRINGAIRGARNSDFDTRQLLKLRDVLEESIGSSDSKTLNLLKAADEHYAKSFIPKFGYGEPLREASQKYQRQVIDTIVHPEKAEIVDQYMSAFDQKGKEAIRAAKLENMFQDSRIETGEYDPRKFASEYRKMGEELQTALFGESKPVMDDLVQKITQGTHGNLISKLGHGGMMTARAAGAGVAMIYGVLAAKDIFEAQMGVGGKRYYIFASADLLRASLAMAPELFFRMAVRGGGGLQALEKIATLNTGDPKYAGAVMAFERAVNETDEVIKKEEQVEKERGE